MATSRDKISSTTHAKRGSLPFACVWPHAACIWDRPHNACSGLFFPLQAELITITQLSKPQFAVPVQSEMTGQWACLSFTPLRCGWTAACRTRKYSKQMTVEMSKKCRENGCADPKNPRQKRMLFPIKPFSFISEWLRSVGKGARGCFPLFKELYFLRSYIWSRAFASVPKVPHHVRGSRQTRVALFRSPRGFATRFAASVPHVAPKTARRRLFRCSVVSRMATTGFSHCTKMVPVKSHNDFFETFGREKSCMIKQEGTLF